MTCGRVQSEARHSLESARCHAETFYRKDPVHRGARTREAHVRGGKSHAAAALGAVHDAPADGVRAAEQCGGFAEIRARAPMACSRRNIREDLDADAAVPSVRW